MATPKKVTLDYHPVAASGQGRRRLILLAIGVAVIASALIVWHNRFRLFYTPNAPWSYTERVGGDAALREITRAVSAYAEAHAGSLPARLVDVKPFIRKPSEWRYLVTPEEMLPHAVLIRRGEGQANLNTTERWSFAIVVHVLGAGPMRFNWTLVDADTQFPYDDSVRDPDFIAAFGAQRLQQVKQSAYQLP